MNTVPVVVDQCKVIGFHLFTEIADQPKHVLFAHIKAAHHIKTAAVQGLLHGLSKIDDVSELAGFIVLIGENQGDSPAFICPGMFGKIPLGEGLKTQQAQELSEKGFGGAEEVERVHFLKLDLGEVNDSYYFGKSKEPPRR